MTIMAISISQKIFGVIAIILFVAVGVFAYGRGWIPWLRVPGTTPPVQDGSFRIPGGFTIDDIAEDLNKPRVIAFDPKGRLLVSEMGAGNVITLESGKKRVVIGGLRTPHGLAF